MEEISKKFLTVNRWDIKRDANQWIVCEEIKSKKTNNLNEAHNTYHASLEDALIEVLERMKLEKITYHEKDITKAIKEIKKLYDDFLADLAIAIAKK